MSRSNELTERELEVIRIMADGKTNEEIAMVLGVSSRAVARRIERAWQATDTHNRTQLACTAIRNGWIR